ncbi:NERD domain-containing protein [Gracilibacillus xinjiangensis]|uniref:NERD domain-containing protein n=1 Tax=Gracilibacillus xinjiangensis TaxID=1193282 RepID=A0ABV8WV46_9BACI
MIPVKQLQYEALLAHLPKAHPLYSRIYDHYGLFEAGNYGENSIDYYVDVAGLDDFHLLKGLRMRDRQNFQIDRLIVTNRFILLLEIKNITGSLYFDHQAHQLFRETDESKDVFPDPLLQVNIQAAQLRRILLKHRFRLPPIITACVFVHPKARLLLHDYPDHSQILTSMALPSYLQKITKQFSPVLSIEEMERIIEFLKSNHEEATIDILEKYQILWEDLMKGVYCPSCLQYTMIRKRRRWECNRCGVRSSDAHLAHLFELALLTGNRITNQLAREFLQVDSADMMKKLLAKEPFIKIGRTKGAYYQHSDLMDRMR